MSHIEQKINYNLDLKHIDLESYDVPICDTCQSKIESMIYRVVIYRDKDKNPTLRNYHFFFPCWDLDFIYEKYRNYKIDRAGFSCDESFVNPEYLKKLKYADLWIS